MRSQGAHELVAPWLLSISIFLSQSLSREAGGMSYEGTPQAILDRAAEIDQQKKI